MQEQRRKSQAPGICHRLFTFIMNSLIARSHKKSITISSHHRPMPQDSSNGVLEGQQPLVTDKPNEVESIYLQQASRGYIIPENDSPFEIQVHYKKTDDDDNDDDESKMNGSTDTLKLSSSKSLQEVYPIFTSVSPKKSLSIEDVVEMEEEKNGARLTMAMAGGEDEITRIPSNRERPNFHVVRNINEMSDEFIRSRKEAMRRSHSLT